MKLAVTAFFLFLACGSYGQQQLIPFAGRGPTDTAFADRSLRVTRAVRFDMLANPAGKIVAASANGTLYLVDAPYSATEADNLFVAVQDSSFRYVTPADMAAAIAASAYVSPSKRGVSTQSGNGVTLLYYIPHGLGVKPAYFNAPAKRGDAVGLYGIDADATNIIIEYKVAPASGTNNLVWFWVATP